MSQPNVVYFTAQTHVEQFVEVLLVSIGLDKSDVL